MTVQGCASATVCHARLSHVFITHLFQTLDLFTYIVLAREYAARVALLSRGVLHLMDFHEALSEWH